MGKFLNYFGFGKQEPVTLLSFLHGKSEMNYDEVCTIINNSIGDFQVIEDNPQYASGDYPDHRVLIVQYNGRMFNIHGYVQDGMLNMSSPIEALYYWAIGKESQYMI
jgi:hypothetical protein